MNEEERIIRSIKYIINQNYVDTEDDIIGILIKALNLIEKQYKEIEKINYIKRSFDYCVEQENKKWEDKIKAKIEELDYNDIGNFERRCKQEVLQSLLEKE